MKEPYGKENSESILALSLAGGIVRCFLKRRQRYWWAGLLSFEKPMVQDANSVPSGDGLHLTGVEIQKGGGLVELHLQSVDDVFQTYSRGHSFERPS